MQKGLPLESALALTGGVLLLLTACSRSSGAPPAPATVQEESPAVSVTKPQRGAGGRVVREPGTLLPYDHAALYARVSGYLEHLDVDIGDRVRRGQVLAQLSAPDVETRVRAARAELEKAHAAAELAAATFARYTDLDAKAPGATTIEQVDVAKAEARVAEARSRAATEALAEAETWQAYTKIRAPFDGVVTKRFSDIGTLIGAGSKEGPAVVQVDRVDLLRLAFDLPEGISPYARRGTKVRFAFDALPGQSYSGVVARTSGSLDPATRSLHVELDIPNEGDRLKPGLFATVELDLDGLSGAWTVPADCVVNTRSSAFVFTVSAGTVQRLPVELILDLGASVLVRGDLADGSLVVRRPPLTMVPGEKVRSQMEGGA